VPILIDIRIDADLKIRADALDGTYAECEGDPVSLRTDPVRGVLDAIAKRSASAAQLQSAGSALFQQVFQRDVLGLLRSLEERARTAREALHIRLEVAPAWQGLAWELMYDEAAHEFLAFAADKSLFRTIRCQATAHPVTRPYRIAIVGASPPDQPQLSIQEEVDAVTAAVRALPRSEDAIVPPNHRATRAQLNQIIGTEKPGIVHFIGHGSFNGQEGSLALIDTDGRGTEWVSEGDLSIALMGCSHIGLIVLNACESAAAGATAFSGVGPALVGTRVPAVIAMQYRVRDESAVVFARSLYGHLSGGHSVQDAVQGARKQLAAQFGPADRDAFAPVLFARGEPVAFGRAPQPAAAVLPVSTVPPPTAHFVSPHGFQTAAEAGLSTKGGILISAEGGYGKTECTRSIAQRFQGRVAWIECTRATTDESTLLVDIADRAQQRFGIDLSAILAMLEDPAFVRSKIAQIPGRAAEAVAADLESKLSRECLFVCDDAHELGAELRDRVLVPLTRRRPRLLKSVVLNGGVESPVYRQLCDEGRLTRLGREHLSFDVSDVQHYLRARFGRDVPEPICAALQNATEGWPMAFGLIADSDGVTDAGLQDVVRDLRASPERVYDALLSRAYARQDAATQQVLRVLSVTRRFPPEWLNSVLQMADGGATIRELSASNGFVLRSDASPNEWRLHSLFRTFLRQRLRDEESETGVRKWFERSRAFWSSTGETLTAVLDALDMGFMEEAAHDLEEVAEYFVASGKLSSFLSLASRIPPAVTAAHATLSIYIAQAQHAAGRSRDAAATLDAVRDWSSARQEKYLGRLLRVLIAEDSGAQPREAGAEELARIRDAALADRAAMIAAQATLKRVEILTPGAYGHPGFSSELAAEALEAEASLHARDDEQSWSVRAHLLIAVFRLRWQDQSHETLSLLSRARLNTELGVPPSQEQKQRVLAFLQHERELKEVLDKTRAAVNRSRSALTTADFEYTWSDFVVGEALARERNRPLAGQPPSSEEIRVRTQMLEDHHKGLEQVVAVYDAFEMPHNVAMTQALRARISRMLGALERSDAELNAAAAIAAQLPNDRLLTNIASVRSGFYDYDYAERQAEAALADADDAALVKAADQLVEHLRPEVRAEAVRTARAELAEARAHHRARREWCRYLELVETPDGAVATSSRDPGAQMRLKMLRCLRFPDRASAIPCHECEPLVQAFKRTACEGCTDRQPAPAPQ
jgi:hypothetical protein